MVEVGRPPEPRDQPLHELSAFRARLMFADQNVLDPSEKLKEEEITEEMFPSLLDSNLRVVSNAAKYDRGSYWRHRAEAEGFKNTPSQDMERWMEDTGRYMGTFWQENPDLQPFLSQAFGVTQPDELTKDHLEAFYRRYFIEPARVDDKDVSHETFFMNNLLETFKDEEKYDVDKLARNADAIQKLCGLYGKRYDKPEKAATDKVLLERIIGEAEREKDKAAYVGQAKSFLTGSVSENTKDKEYLEHLSALPFDREDVQTDLINLAKKNKRSLLMAGTGSGKTTLAPIILANDPAFADYKFYTSLPTQFVTEGSEYLSAAAAKRGMADLAKRISWEHGDDDKLVDPKIEKIRMMTEGVLTHRLMQINTEEELDKFAGELKNVFLLFDEAHLLNPDGLLAYYKGMKLQEEYPDRVKIAFMSATANKNLFKTKGKISEKAIMNVEVPPRYTIEAFFETPEESGADIFNTDVFTAEKVSTDACARVEGILKNQLDSRNIIVGLSGEEEIRKLDTKVRSLLASNPDWSDIEVMWIYGNSTPEDKQAAKEMTSDKTKRTICLCTNAVQTGVTLEGVTDVVISPFAKRTFYNKKLGENELVLTLMSLADLGQWRGRTGRKNNGRVHYMYLSEQEYSDALRDFPKNETERADLAKVLLTLVDMGVKHIHKDLLIAKMDPELIMLGLRKLKMLDAIKADNTITEFGERMDQKPVDYHLARAIVEAEEHGAAEEMVSIAAILSAQTKGFFSDLRRVENADRVKEQRKEFLQNPEVRGGEIRGSDPLVILNIWRKYQQIREDLFPGKTDLTGEEMRVLSEEQADWCKKYGISLIAIRNVERNREKILRRSDVDTHVQSRGSAHSETVERAFCQGYKDKILSFDVLTNEHGSFVGYKLDENPSGDDDSVWTSPHIEIDSRLPFPTTVFPRRRDHFHIVTTGVREVEGKSGQNRYFTGFNQRFPREWRAAA